MPNSIRSPQRPVGPLTEACAEWARLPGLQMQLHRTLMAFARPGSNQGAPAEVRRQIADQSNHVEAYGRAIGAHVARTFAAANDDPAAPPAPTAA